MNLSRLHPLGVTSYTIALEAPPAEPLAAGYDYILAGNGLFLRAANRFFALTQCIAPATVRGLVPLEPSFELKVPCLPAALLTTVLAHARTQGQREILYYVRHDGQKCRLTVPAQHRSATHILSSGGGGDDILLEIHSHHAMPAFWSETDNQDELGFRAYMVLGRIFGNRPELRLRIGVYGYHFELPVSALFVEATLAGNPFSL
ncbi:MAG: Mov34/MPN/PAD-1 family protein [Anaerolineales bacterium]|nr:Mov34/MPN/PAD-1 family protein [Anaerolineales bacterium]